MQVKTFPFSPSLPDTLGDEAIFGVDVNVCVPIASALVVVGPVAVPSVIEVATLDCCAADDNDMLREDATELVATFLDDVDAGDSSA